MKYNPSGKGFLYDMANDSSFELDFSKALVLENNMTFQQLVGQLQSESKNLLCVINGQNLFFFKHKQQIPKNIRFDHAQKVRSQIEYYFTDLETRDVYCVFGRKAAELFSPAIKNGHSPSTVETTRKRTIIDGETTLTFIDEDLPLELVQNELI